MPISNLLTRLRVWWQRRDDDLERQVYDAIDDLSPGARVRIFSYVQECCHNDFRAGRS